MLVQILTHNGSRDHSRQVWKSASYGIRSHGLTALVEMTLRPQNNLSEMRYCTGIPWRWQHIATCQMLLLADL